MAAPDFHSGAACKTPESIDAPLVFAGSGEAPEGLDQKGKILVQWNGGAGAGRGGRGGANAHPGIAGTLSIDTIAGPEPPRWPVQYAVQIDNRRWRCAGRTRRRRCRGGVALQP